MTNRPDVTIIGAGPSGCLLALLLADNGARLTIYDSRVDTRLPSENATQGDQRSINLAISTRGLTALSRVKLSKVLESQGIPMHARCIHPHGKTQYELHPYGQPNQFLLSVSRTTLTELLQNACDAHEYIQLNFKHKCTDINLSMPSVTVKDDLCGGVCHVIRPFLLVGADGTFSKVRGSMSREPGFNFSQEYIPCLYKELSFIPSQNDQYVPNALHIWPRQDFMLIALPNWSKQYETTNSPKSFTATLFMPPDKFKSLKNDDDIIQFFKQHFKDALSSMPNLINDFNENPTAPLVTIRCNPYNHHEKAVLIGDAAHAIVPFYGQGCNAAMEDAVLLADSIAKYGWNDVGKALDEYSKLRKGDADTIADLAQEHYYDMSSRSASKFHVLKRSVEIWLNSLFPKKFLPLYSLISFSNVPYSKAVSRSKMNDTIIGTGIGLAVASALFLTSAAVLVGMNKQRASIYTRFLYK